MPRLGLTESLEAPGLAAAPPISQAASDLSALVETFGQAGQAVGQYGAVVRRRQAEAEQADKEAELFDRGAASQQAALDAERWNLDVQNGKITAPTDPESIAAMARTMAEAEVQEGVPAAYRDEYTKRSTLALTRILSAKASETQTQARKDSLQALKDGAAGQADPAEIGRYATAAMTTLGLTEAEAAAEVGLYAMQIAAASGNKQAFDAAKAFLGDRFASDQTRFGIAMKQRQDAEAAAHKERARDSVFEMLNEGKPAETVMSAIHRMRQMNTIDEDTAFSLSNMVKDREKVKDQQIIQQHLDQYNKQQEEAIVAEWTERSMAADEDFGLVLLPPEGVSWTDQAGKTHKLSQAELKRSVVRRAIAAITKANPDPDVATAQIAAYLALNDATVPEWSQTLNAGYMSATTATVMSKPGGAGQVVAPLPASTKQGYELSKRLRQHSPQVWAAHLSADARAFYETAELAEKYIDTGDPQAALLRAAMTNPLASTGATISPADKAISDNLDIDRDSNNYGQIRHEVARLATLYARSPGLPFARAVEEAVKKVTATHRKIGNSYVYTGDRHVPKDIDVVFQDIAAEYVGTFGLSQQVEAKDLTMIPGAAQGTWILWDETTNAPVESWRSWGFFTTADLAKRSASKRQTAGTAAADKAAKDAAELFRQNRIPPPEDDGSRRVWMMTP